MQKKRTWRDVLAQIFEDSFEVQRIAQELEVHPMTLKRWIKKNVTPRQQNLHRLLEVLPQHREALIQHLQVELAGFVPPANYQHSNRGDQTGIAAALYENILQIYAHTLHKFRFNNICEAIITDALKLLDPEQLGMSITISSCMPPQEGIIRSLRERVGRGTPPWSTMVEHRASLLGTESLTGNAVIQGHLVSNPNLDSEQSLSAGYGAKWEKSAIAAPIMRGGMIAGSAVFASTQIHYFTPERRVSIQHYTNLLALAFEPQDFYQQEIFHLGHMPTDDDQRPHFTGFKKRITQITREAGPDQPPIPYPQAEAKAWQEMEDHFLQWRNL